MRTSSDFGDLLLCCSFVIKTTDDTKRKVFINVCSSELVPAPGNWVAGKVPEEVLKALENTKSKQDASFQDALRFPLSCSDPREDSDKKGEPCSIFDCIFNVDVVKQAKAFRLLKQFLIDLCLEWIGQKVSVRVCGAFHIIHFKEWPVLATILAFPLWCFDKH